MKLFLTTSAAPKDVTLSGRTCPRPSAEILPRALVANDRADMWT